MSRNALWFLLPAAVAFHLAGCDSSPGGESLSTAAGASKGAAPAPAATPTPTPTPTPTDTSTPPAAVCPDPTAPRASAEPIAGPSVQVKVDAWQAALDQYGAAVAQYNVEAAAHAAAYSAAATGVLGTACTTDADCDTQSPDFIGSCRVPYYGQAQCAVRDANPQPGAPPVPPQPVFDCTDYSCPGDFQCEVELETGSITCLAPRPKCPASPADSGTGGSGGGHGGRP